MRGWFIGTVLTATAVFAQPVFAATGLECIEDGYTAEQQQVFDDYFVEFTADSLSGGQDDGSGRLAEPISSRATECAAEHGWSPDAVYDAIIFRLSVLLAAALEVKTPLTPEQMAALEDAIADADQEKLRAVLGPGIEASLKGQDGPELTEEDKLFLGMIFVGAGLPEEQGYSEYAGALLGARLMAEMAAEKFAAD